MRDVRELRQRRQPKIVSKPYKVVQIPGGMLDQEPATDGVLTVAAADQGLERGVLDLLGPVHPPARQPPLPGIDLANQQLDGVVTTDLERGVGELVAVIENHHAGQDLILRRTGKPITKRPMQQRKQFRRRYRATTGPEGPHYDSCHPGDLTPCLRMLVAHAPGVTGA
jgi:hypothetical protein